MVLNGLARLQTQFLKGWPSLKEPDIEGVLERFYEVASAPRSRAYARVADSVGTGVKTMRSGILSPAARRMHAGRVRRAHDEGRRPPELEESLFAAAFLAIVVLGDSLFRSSVRRAVGLSSSSEQKRRFQRWLAGGIRANGTTEDHRRWRRSVTPSDALRLNRSPAKRIKENYVSGRIAAPERFYSPILFDLPIAQALGTERHGTAALPGLRITRLHRAWLDTAKAQSQRRGRPFQKGQHPRGSESTRWQVDHAINSSSFRIEKRWSSAFAADLGDFVGTLSQKFRIWRPFVRIQEHQLAHAWRPSRYDCAARALMFSGEC